MNRREFLSSAAVGLGAAVAGCTTTNSNNSTSPNDNPDEIKTATLPYRGTTVTERSAEPQAGVKITQTSPSTLNVLVFILKRADYVLATPSEGTGSLTFGEGDWVDIDSDGSVEGLEELGAEGTLTGVETIDAISFSAVNGNAREHLTTFEV